MKIDQFFGTKRKNVQEVIANTKEGQRKAEMAHLKPDPLRPYTGPPPIIDDITRLSVMLVFPDDNELEKFKRQFRVAQHGEASVTNIEVLIALLDEMEAGRIFYEKDSGTINYRGEEVSTA